MPTDPTHKSYLGDGAYVRLGAYAGEVILTTEDGISAQNTVVLGPTETRELLNWLFERGLDVKLSRLEERVRELEARLGDLENPI